MKFRNISGGPLALPTLGIQHVDPDAEFEVTGAPAKWLASDDAAHLVQRTDKKDDDPTGSTANTDAAGGGSEDGKK